MNGYIGEIALILALIVLNGFFAAAEMALVSARRVALRSAADEGSANARAALDLVDEPSRFLAAIQVGITLAGFMASATAAVSLAGIPGDWLRGLGIDWLAGIASGVSVFMVTLVISYLTLVFGELAPKRLALHRSEVVAMRVARPIALMATITHPITWALARSTETVARLLGVREETRKATVTEDEIRLLVAEQTSLLEEEKRIIQEVFDLGDTVAREIMIPRVDMVMLEDTAKVGEALEEFERSGYSRIPVFHEEPDRVVGILLLKDLLGPLAQERTDETVAGYMREITFVPETKAVLPLLTEMQRARNHLVIVLDEYGGTAGLLTIEDIIEEVVGEITDEFDIEERYITRLDEGDHIIDGRLSIEDANEALGLGLEESEEYETLAGWVLARLGHIPTAGETVRHGDVEIRVQAVRRRRIARLRVIAHADEHRAAGRDGDGTEPRDAGARGPEARDAGAHDPEARDTEEGAGA